jgi:hypothetical protein
LEKTAIMTTPSFDAGDPAHARRGVIRALAAVTATVERMFDVFAEAGHQSSAARSRYPLAD